MPVGRPRHAENGYHSLMTEQLDPVLADYLLTNRDFVAPAVAEAVSSLGLGAGARVLDAGTGAGGALPALARAVGPGGEVHAIDLNPAVAALASDHAAGAGIADTVTVRTGDIRQVLAEAADGVGFDAVWTSDVVWPGNFDDPGELVRRMAAALRPGGVAALFYSNYYQATFLPGHSRLERLLRTASELRWKLPFDGPHHNERHLAWLSAAGLDDVAVRIFPRIAFPLDRDPAARAYLETAVWPELRTSAAACGAEAGMSAADLEEADALLTPGGPRSVMDEPGFFVMHPTIVATGRRAVG